MMENAVMTPEEFKARMEVASKTLYSSRSCGAGNIDEEESHIRMDDLMCEVLTSLGYGEGVDIFVKTYKWYS